MNELRGEDVSRFEKQIVPLKKHIHCNCFKNELILCAVHEDDDEIYEESISFAKRMGNGGYDEIQSTTQTDESVSRELSSYEIEQLFEES